MNPLARHILAAYPHFPGDKSREFPFPHPSTIPSLVKLPPDHPFHNSLMVKSSLQTEISPGPSLPSHSFYEPKIKEEPDQNSSRECSPVRYENTKSPHRFERSRSPTNYDYHQSTPRHHSRSISPRSRHSPSSRSRCSPSPRS